MGEGMKHLLKTIEEMHGDVAQSAHEEAPPIEAPPLRAPLVEGATTSTASPPLPQSTQQTPPTSSNSPRVKVMTGGRRSNHYFLPHITIF